MMHMLKSLPGITHLNSGNFFLIAGPCVVENATMPLEIAITIKNICNRLEIPFIFKASYRKANRTKSSSFKGIGDKEALEVLGRVRSLLKTPTLSDIHSESEASIAADYVDVLQIPAFLCRQTELLQAAARTGKMVNIKKGQFVSAESMVFAARKVIDEGNPNVMLTERGSMFGYHDLVVDYRNIYSLKKLGYPVVLDVTHSLQQPNQPEGVSGGQPEMIETIAMAGVAAGVDGIFIETHPEPAKALSDGANMLPLAKLEDLLTKLVKVRRAILP